MDKENVFSLIKNKDHDLYEDCLKTMRKQLNVKFNFKKEELDPVLLAWFSHFTSGVGKETKQTFNEVVFPERPLKSNSYITFNKDQLSATYLISDERIQLLIDKGAVLIGAPGEEVSIFNQLFFNQSDYKFDKKIGISDSKFNSWKFLQPYSLALSDVLIIDSFILSDASLIQSNLLEYLKVIVTRSKCKVNIVVYTNESHISMPYIDLSKQVRDAVSAVTGVQPNFTLVKFKDQRGVQSFAEHDRTIFTNYFRVYSGDTFNYFKSNGDKITKGREIHYTCYGDRENHELAKVLISDIQKNLDSMPATATEGDKKSNFLTFK